MNNQKINTNGFFSELENTRPFVKIAFEGFAGSGKTFTATEIAIGLHRKIKSTKPIVFFDTEKSLKALKPKFDKAKIKVQVKESRTLADLNKSIKICEDGFADILVIDSITHVYENFLEAYRTQKKRDFLQFQDWGIIKPKWKKEFSDPFVSSNLHIIFTGRAGYEYEDFKNEETGKREIYKSGIKMKAENETAYEPDLLILMERFEKVLDANKQIWREATIIKDRTTTIDGKTFKNPSYKEFEPAVNIMLDGQVKDVHSAETPDTFEEREYDNSRTYRQIELENIEGALVQLFPGQSKEEKKLKVDVLERLFMTRSWKEIEITALNKLKEANSVLNIFKSDLQRQLKLDSEEGRETSYDKIMEILDSSILIAWDVKSAVEERN